MQLAERTAHLSSDPLARAAGTMYPYLGPWPGTARLLSETAAVRAGGAGGEHRQC